jgi:hypothetical protein
MIPKIITTCKNCMFSTLENEIQTGCELGRLDKFRERGVKVNLVEDHYEIEERRCTTNVVYDSPEIPLDEIKQKVTEYVNLKYSMICLVGKDSTKEEVGKTVHSFFNQDPLPQSIFVLLTEESHSRPTYINLMRSFNGVKWTVLKGGYEKTSDELIDDAVRSIDSNFLTVCHAGYTYHRYWADDINIAINDELKTFLCLVADESGNAGLYLKNVYEAFGGNIQKPFEEKLIEIALEEGKMNLILTYEQLISQENIVHPTSGNAVETG